MVLLNQSIEKEGIPMETIVRNIIQCKQCGDIIESNYTHDFKACHCGSCAVDGGKDYLHRTSRSGRDGFIELSEFEQTTPDTKPNFGK
jgi:hypothetical protein